MTDIDYSILYRREVRVEDLRELSKDWSLYLSGFNGEERVQVPFGVVVAGAKQWVVHPQYDFAPEEIPQGAFSSSRLNEAEFWSEFFETVGPELADEFCVDITGMLVPHLMFLCAELKRRKVSRFHVLYTEPEKYAKDEHTRFHKGPVLGVRQVAGFEGTHETDGDNDLLVVGIGYENESVRRVAELKSNIRRKVQLFSLPSLQPEMYQQSVVRMYGTGDAMGTRDGGHVIFAPANDPFVTAQVLHDRINEERRSNDVANVYLASLATKPQALGFALYYLTECTNTATSILCPEIEAYEPVTSQGVGRSWMYTIEFLEAE